MALISLSISYGTYYGFGSTDLAPNASYDTLLIFGSTDISPSLNYSVPLNFGSTLQPISPVLTQAYPVLTGEKVINRVWDTQVIGTDKHYSWVTDEADPGGVYYDGPGTYGVHTSEYCVTSRYQI
jgi:hypothetical protein